MLKAEPRGEQGCTRRVATARAGTEQLMST
jgi:hypothetical protein